MVLLHVCVTTSGTDYPALWGGGRKYMYNEQVARIKSKSGALVSFRNCVNVKGLFESSVVPSVTL